MNHELSTMNRYVAMLEDDSDDRYMTKETLEELGIDVPVRFFYSSNELFDFLAASEKPSLILTDYNTSPDNGLEVLKKLKAHPAYGEIPVVVLSDSDLPHYKNQCYLHGASSFIKKPDTVEATKQKIGTFFKYWFEVAELG
jgi:CheY-like chemotaxis protein